MRSATLVSLQPSADVWDWDCSPVRTEREARHIAAAPCRILPSDIATKESKQHQ